MHLPWIEAFEDIFSVGITIIIHGLELMGVIVVVTGAVKAFYNYFVRHSLNIRLSLAQSMAIGLEFKLGGEILRTVIARDWNEILTVGAIILLRAALNFLIHWEIGHIQDDAKLIDDASHPVDPEKTQTINRLHADGHISDEEAAQLRAKLSGKTETHDS